MGSNINDEINRTASSGIAALEGLITLCEELAGAGALNEASLAKVKASILRTLKATNTILETPSHLPQTFEDRWTSLFG